MEPDSGRIPLLVKFLDRSLRTPPTAITTSRHASLFIEALVAKGSGLGIATLLIDRPLGLDALKTAVTLDMSFAFYETTTSNLLRILKNDQALASLDKGAVLLKVVKALLEAPGYYSSIKSLACDGTAANRDAIRGDFAWLLFCAVQTDPATLGGLCADDAHSSKLTATLRSSADGDHWISKISQYEQDGPADVANYCILSDGAGGRHDNDFENVANISILPTCAELDCNTPAHLLTAAEVDYALATTASDSLHVDNMFRLLREDMLSDLKEVLAKTRQNTASGRQTRYCRLQGVLPVAVTCPSVYEQPPFTWSPWTVQFQYHTVLPGLSKNEDSKQRVGRLKDLSRPEGRILPPDTLVTIVNGGRLVGFGHISRNPEALAKDPALIDVKFDPSSVRRVLECFQLPRINLALVQVDAAVFAYEPFLTQLQRMDSIPMSDALVHWQKGDSVAELASKSDLIDLLSRDSTVDIGPALGIDKQIFLEKSQAASLQAALTQRVALIQGPPGTGKSFIGALLIKALLQGKCKKILIASFTNHALDQFAEDLLDVGVPEDSIVRLGSKSTTRTEGMLLRKKNRNSKLTRSDWVEIDDAKLSLSSSARRLKQLFQRIRPYVTNYELLNNLEFRVDSDAEIYEAFKVNGDKNGFIVSHGKRAMRTADVFKRWLKGDSVSGAGHEIHHPHVWNLESIERQKLRQKWAKEIQSELLDDIAKAGEAHDAAMKRVREMLQKRDEVCLQSHQIIASTTTAASKFVELLRAVRPEVVLLEEAGEVLEPHVITCLHETTKRLIMIGDHQQLRPKINSYPLTVESEKGYDLNRSLFERLILKGYPHTTLQKQHRMRTSIANIVREMTYPGLEDAPSTSARESIRGLQHNVIFIDHCQPETALERIKDPGSGSSKQNKFEAEFVLKVVRYLAQQGYRSDEVVVLTPYMAQLRLLRDTLATENDPVLNDMDYYELKKAGLIDARDVSSQKNTVHLSSIDNYQGQECKIVVVSLTRSNQDNDIGFMWQPERLNVLVSRARDGLIILGNSSTFENSRRGSRTWKQFFDILRRSDQFMSGLPVQCEKHPLEIRMVQNVLDFATFCPDGGCSQPCPTMLSCGVHRCPSACHMLIDHSTILCQVKLSDTCSEGHITSWRCSHPKPNSCLVCEARAERVKRQRDEKDRQIAEWAALEAEREDMIRQGKHDRETIERKVAILQKQTELADLRKRLQDELEGLEKQTSKPLQPSITATSGPTPQRKDSPDGNIINGRPESTKEAKEAKTKLPPVSELDTTRSKTGSTQPSSSPNLPQSAASDEWQRQKSLFNLQFPAIDDLMNLVGLEKIKQHVLELRDRIQLSQRQNADMSKDRFNAAFLGNPGTGKTTVARLYGQVLCSLGIIGSASFEETSGSKLGTDGVQAAAATIKKLVAAGGGVFFVDEAYQLTEGAVAGGKGVLDFLLAEMENRVGTIVFIFAGYTKQMDAFMGHNPGIPSRIPDRLIFDDYTSEQFVHFLNLKFQKRFHSKAKVEDGLNGLASKIVGERLGRRATQPGFANMRDLEIIFQRICSRQATRIREERARGVIPDDFEFTRADLIGPDPSIALSESSSWIKLQKLIGLDQVKQQVQSFATLVGSNYQRELQGKAPMSVSLNKIFLGPPGTGKTSVAKLYGKLLAEMGMLSNGEVIVKTPADFIGSHLGESEKNTSAILESSVGKVLVIDEAYMLAPDAGNGSTSVVDPYRVAVIDTIVANVHNIPGDDRCVLLLGYQDQMEHFLQAANPGLARRFPLSDAFHFESFNQEELGRVLSMKLQEQGVDVSDVARAVVMDQLERDRRKPNFGNAGEVANRISQAISKSQKRLLKQSTPDTIDVLEPEDFDADFKRSEMSTDIIKALFKDSIGSEGLVTTFTRICDTFKNAKARGMNPVTLVPFTFRFCGPPGTGKTSTARKIGTIYYNMGILAESEVVESSAGDLVANYVGQTAQKTRKLLEKALGKVLLIDEAYRLIDNSFGLEAINELVDLLTKPRFQGNLIIILAGYPAEMDRLFRSNPGLESRFPESIFFEAFSPEQCVDLFHQKIQERNIQCSELTCVDSPSRRLLQGHFARLCQTSAWGNARDIGNLADKVVREALGRQNSVKMGIEIGFDLISRVFEDAVNQRMRSTLAPGPSFRQVQSTEAQLDLVSASELLPPSPAAPTQRLSTQQKSHETQTHTPPASSPPPSEQTSLEHQSAAETRLESLHRDSGVSDDVWAQLQADMQAGAAREQQRNDELVAVESCAQKARDDVTESESRVATLESACLASGGESDDDSDENDARLRALEKARVALAEKKAAQAREIERQKRLQAQIAEERRKEAAAQARLKQMGVCPQGFAWIKQKEGWRCAGGSHFVDGHNL